MNSFYDGGKNTIIINFLVERRFLVWRQLLFIFGFIYFIFTSSFPEDYNYLASSFVIVIFILMAYINIYVLVPNFFFKGKYLAYIFLLITLVGFGICLLSITMQMSVDNIKEIKSVKKIIQSYNKGIFIIAPMILVTTTVKLLQKWINDTKRLIELQNITTTMELNELKNQINPHFLFNMLNNVKALIRKDPEKASLVIMKLSDFLRYQLYENNEEKTSLFTEIEFLSNFLNLEKIRREDLEISITTSIDNGSIYSHFIPPNLFTTFVENAVKHSLNIDDKPSYISLNFQIINNHLLFECKNSIDPNFRISNKKYNGLGLPNISRRLELIYGNSYNLIITPSENDYLIKLNLPL